MSNNLIFMLEELSMKNVLDQLLPKIIPDEITYICITHQGKQDLEKSIPKKIEAFQYSPDTRFIIVHDQDSNDCKELKSELLKICQTPGKDNNVMIRIICHELESWFLGDLAAVEKAYNMKPNSLSKQQSKQKYRNPDQLNSAKQELKRLVKEYYPGIHSKKIAPYLSLTDNTSHSFQVFIKGIKHLLEVSP
ncbi:MAG: DUF4276 family protein [Moorea sp. SIO2I5]|nr:DUF4276 family protein [Moorena sp. SIO2I5]